jgi:hypothetical protein
LDPTTLEFFVRNPSIQIIAGGTPSPQRGLGLIRYLNFIGIFNGGGWDGCLRLLGTLLLPVETSAIFVSELRLTPRARDSSFISFKSFSSIVEYDE